MFTEFNFNNRGGLSVDRKALHDSEGYARQMKALAELRDITKTGGKPADTTGFCERESI